jgi:hypothetical protein
MPTLIVSGGPGSVSLTVAPGAILPGDSYWVAVGP